LNDISLNDLFAYVIVDVLYL